MRCAKNIALPSSMPRKALSTRNAGAKLHMAGPMFLCQGQPQGSTNTHTHKHTSATLNN
jgi:hypothetical protein